MDVLGSTSLIVRMVSVDVKQHRTKLTLPAELRSCVRVEVDVLGSVSLIFCTGFVVVEQHLKKKKKKKK